MIQVTIFGDSARVTNDISICKHSVVALQDQVTA